MSVKLSTTEKRQRGERSSKGTSDFIIVRRMFCRAKWLSTSFVFRFNQQNGTNRDVAQLINQWRNTKNNIKKRNLEYKNHNAIDRGPRLPNPPPSNVELMLIKEFEEDENGYDCDSLYIEENHRVISDIFWIKSSHVLRQDSKYL